MTTARFYWLKHDAALLRCDDELADVWKTKALEAEAALDFVPLPAEFPARAALLAARYVSVADLLGEPLDALLAAGLPRRDAIAALAAATALPA